ncbi:MAG: hypothetical protein E7049_08225 [Lentisphaerae bacterium]|nr:hypothetical protein [Lentisphaerota bacterium]
MDMISTIAGLLSLCGITSVRMFAPTFLFGLICRVLPAYSWCPEGISELAANCPPFLTGNFGLFVFGVLGAIEIAANWEDSLRELISETNIEKYAKPVFAMLVSYSICTPEQMQVLSAAMDGVPEALPMACDPTTVTNTVAVAAESASASSSGGLSFSAIFASIFCGGGTFGFCNVRAWIASSIRELDPDNTLHLNTFLTLFEEGSWLAILPIVLVFPILALFLMAVFAVVGWMLSIPLKKLTEKRRAYWNAMGKDGMLMTVRNRAIAIFVIGVLISGIPVLGYVATVVALNQFVFGVLALYEKASRRILMRLIMRFMKLTIFLVSILISGIPFMGIILLAPYMLSYLIRSQKIKSSC